MFRHDKVETTSISRVHENGRRWYKLPNDVRYPSVTTVLSYNKDKTSINKWKNKMTEKYGGAGAAAYISENAMGIGTAVHTLIEDYLNNKVDDEKGGRVPLLHQAHFDNMLPYLNKINNICMTEGFLFSERLKIAGTVDCIAEYNGVLSVIDFKTARSEKREEWIQDYFMQCTAYATMFEEQCGRKCDQIVVLISSEDGAIKEYVRRSDDYLQELGTNIAKYEAKNG